MEELDFMKKGNLLFIITSILILGCSSQKSDDIINALIFDCFDVNLYGKLALEEYGGIPPSCLNLYYNETYSMNDNFWFTGVEADCELNIVNNVYRCECGFGTNFYVWCGMCELDLRENFQIEVDLEIKSAVNTCSINWGGYEANKNTFRFGIDSNRGFEITNTKNGQSLPDIVPLKFNSNIRKPGINKLTIRYVNGFHYFFINENLVFEDGNIKLYGKEITLRVGAQSLCEFDNIKLYNITL